MPLIEMHKRHAWCVVDNFQALIQYSDAIAAQTGKAVCFALLLLITCVLRAFCL